MVYSLRYPAALLEESYGLIIFIILNIMWIHLKRLPKTLNINRQLLGKIREQRPREVGLLSLVGKRLKGMCLFSINISWSRQQWIEEIFELNSKIDVRASGYKRTKCIYLSRLQIKQYLIEVWGFIKAPEEQQREQLTAVLQWQW